MEQMTAQEALDSARGMTFEKAWALIQEDHRKWEAKFAAEEKKRAAEEKKRAAEEKKRAAEEKKRAAEEKKREAKRAAEEKKREAKRAAEIKEQDARRAAEMAEFKRNLEKAVGHLGNSLGELTEALFSGALYKQFEALGYEFSTQSPNTKFFENKRCVAEVDCWLEDGDYVMAVEVKTKPTNADVDRHVEKLGIIRDNMNKRAKDGILIGAIAGGVVNEDVIKYAHHQGFYVMVQSGESVKVIDPPKGFKVREW